MKITELQQDVTIDIKRQIEQCFQQKDRKHVVEIYLPTGWGKTRAVCQALLKWSNKIRNMRLTIIIFPRSGVLLKPWRNCLAWCSRRQSTIQECRLRCRDFEPVKPMPRLERKRVSPTHLELICVRDAAAKDNTAEIIPIRAIRGNRTGWNFLLNRRQNDPRGPLGKKGPIVIVIDEFHRRNLFFIYQKYVADSGKYENLYDYFIDHLGLSERARKVIFLLVSATPINPVNEREMRVSSDIEDSVDNVEDYGAELHEEIVRWRTVVASLNGQTEPSDSEKPHIRMLHKGRISSSINSIWRSGQRRLGAELSKRTTDAKKSQKVASVRKWLNDYHSAALVAYSPPSDMPLYVVENLWLGGVRNLNYVSRRNYGHTTRNIIKRLHDAKETRNIRSLKLITLVQFLKSPQNANRKFVVFCVYQGTAAMLKEVLHKKQINADWAKGNNPNKLIEAFNERDNLLRVLIATDSLAEGFDLHKAEQHLIHYELAWSPLRMIQRFGRTWRIMESTGNLTKPVAYHIPHTYSSDEEVLNRLQRRWKILKEKTNLYFPSMEIVLGHRLSPFPE